MFSKPSRPPTLLRRLVEQNRPFLSLGALGTDVAEQVPDEVAAWLIEETIKLPPVGNARLPAIADLISLLCIDAYHDDIEDRIAQGRKRK